MFYYNGYFNNIKNKARFCLILVLEIVYDSVLLLLLLHLTIMSVGDAATQSSHMGSGVSPNKSPG